MHQRLPALYGQVYDLCRAAELSEDRDISLAQLHRVVRAADGLAATQVERIITLACPPASGASSSHCSQDELFIAIALVAQAQAHQELSVQQAREAVTTEIDAPVPELDVTKIQGSVLSRPVAGPDIDIAHHAMASSSEDPWDGMRNDGTAPGASNEIPSTPSMLQGSSIRGGWGGPGKGNGGKAPQKGSARANSPRYIDPNPTSVSLLPELGGFLFFRHVLYLVKTPLSSAVKRRYSDFVDLHEYLLARYPFRLVPPLPPKRLALPHVNRTQPTGPGQQDTFLEQRRLALARYARGVMSHPAFRNDNMVVSFFTSGADARDASDENNVSTWKGAGPKGDVVEEGLDESWKLSEADIMHVPVDMETKLARTREVAGSLLDRWNGVVAVFERQVRRTEATAAESTRLSLALSSLLESEAHTYQGSSDDSVGVPQGSDAFARSTSLLVSNNQDYADLSTARFHALQDTLDALKNGRDVWVALKELFRRHERLGRDPIPDLEARIQSMRKRWKRTSQEKRPGFEETCARLKSDIELDQKLIERYERRNQRVRVAIWHEVARLQELSTYMSRRVPLVLPFLTDTLLPFVLHRKSHCG